MRLRHASFGEITSQLFVDGHPGHAGDFIWRRLQPAERQAVAPSLQTEGEGSLRWRARHVLVLG